MADLYAAVKYAEVIHGTPCYHVLVRLSDSKFPFHDRVPYSSECCSYTSLSLPYIYTRKIVGANIIELQR